MFVQWNIKQEEASPEAGSPAPAATLLDVADPVISEGEWFLSEGIKGAGDKPEWFASDKYKTLSDQAKGYKELEKKLGSFTGAPKDGYQIPEGMDKDDALVAEVLKFGAETNMNQDGVNKLLGLAMKQAGVTAEVSAEQELAKLGNNANERIKTVENFLKNRLGEEYDEILPLVNSADSIMLVEKLIKATQPAKLPIDGHITPDSVTWADIEKEMFRKDDNGNLLRSVSREHEDKIQRMMKEFGGDRKNIEVIG